MGACVWVGVATPMSDVCTLVSRGLYSVTDGLHWVWATSWTVSLF